MQGRINLVKVFSVTKAREREEIGDRVTAWIAANPHVQILKTWISLTSDSEYHCLSFVLICTTG